MTQAGVPVAGTLEVVVTGTLPAGGDSFVLADPFDPNGTVQTLTAFLDDTGTAPIVIVAPRVAESIVLDFAFADARATAVLVVEAVLDSSSVTFAPQLVRIPSGNGELTSTLRVEDVSGQGASFDNVSITLDGDVAGVTVTLDDVLLTPGGPPLLATLNSAGEALVRATSSVALDNDENVSLTARYVNALGIDVSATLPIEVLGPQPVLDAIVFDEAQPLLIGTQGSALASSSLVSFVVLDEEGTPLGGVQVSFTLETGIGATLQAFDISDGDGRVFTVVSAGTLPGSVSVRATATNAGDIVRTALSVPIAIRHSIPDFASSFLSHRPARRPRPRRDQRRRMSRRCGLLRLHDGDRVSAGRTSHDHREHARRRKFF